MNRYWLVAGIIVLGMVFGSCTRKPQCCNNEIVPIVDFSGIEPLLHKESDTLYIINFWATWCAPCVAELPHFEEAFRIFGDKKLQMVLVNLDFPNQYENRLLPFIKERDLRPKVIMLDDPDANRWIDLVDPSWTGSIPATLIYNHKERHFFERTLERDELLKLIEKLIN